MTQVVLRECSDLLSLAEEEPSKGIWRSQLIAADVQGSSGFYPADVLRRDGPQAFPAGTHVYLDHPTDREEEERPERSVHELAGVLLDDAHYEDGPEGRGLFSRIQFFSGFKERIREMAGHVGLSIRAGGLVEDTPQGRIIRRISEAFSVDVVTRAGAGGRLVYMTENSKDRTGAATAAAGGTGPDSSGGGNAIIQELVKLNERQENLALAVQKLVTVMEADRKKQEAAMKESLNAGQVVAKLMEAKDLPNSSKARLAESYRPGVDLDEAIRKEQAYLKDVMRESGKNSKREDNASGLGGTESTFGLGNVSADDDFAAIEDLLSGGNY